MDEKNELEEMEEKTAAAPDALDVPEVFTTEEDEPTLTDVDTSDLEANIRAPEIIDNMEANPAEGETNSTTDVEPAPAQAAPETEQSDGGEPAPDEPAADAANTADAVEDVEADDAAQETAEQPKQNAKQNAIDWMFDDTMSYFNSMVTGVNYYPELLSVMQGGQAQISLHRRYMLKAIDEKWVNIVEDSLPSLDVCIRNPRHYIEEIEEILPIELSRNIFPRSVKHLAQHTDYISQIQGDEITPSKILNVFREDTIQTYENKFVNTLILRLFIFVNRRYEIALREGSDEKDTMLDFSNEFEHGETKGKVTVHLELDEKPTPGEVVKNYTYTTDVWKRVEKLNNIILTYMNSKFVEDMGKSYIRPPVMRTNALMKNKDLHQLLVLWEFINSYEGAGYSMLVQDDLENVDAKYQSALYATTAMQYLVFRDSVEHGFANNETLDSHLTDKPVMPEIVDKLPEETEVPAVSTPENAPAEKAKKQADKNAPRSLRDTGTDPAKYRQKKLNAFERTVSLALEIALQTADKMEELNPYVPPRDPEEIAEEEAAAAAAAAEEAARIKAEEDAAAAAAKAAEEEAVKAAAQDAEEETAETDAVDAETDNSDEAQTGTLVVTDNAEGADTVDTVEAVDAVDAVDAAETAEIAEPPETTDAADATDTVDTTDITEPVGATETIEPVENAEMAEPIASVGATEPVETAEADDVRERDDEPVPQTPAANGAASFAHTIAFAVDIDGDGDADAVVDTTGDGIPDAVVMNDGNGITAASTIDHSIEVPDAKVDPEFRATIHFSGSEPAANTEQAEPTESPKHRFNPLGWLRRKIKSRGKETKSDAEPNDEVNRRG